MDLTWQDLRTLRSRGQKPELPIVITSGRWPGLWDTDICCIDANGPMDLELLSGLTVLLFTGCRLSENIALELRRNAIQPKRLLGWCQAQGALVYATGGCKCET